MSFIFKYFALLFLFIHGTFSAEYIASFVSVEVPADFLTKVDTISSDPALKSKARHKTNFLIAPDDAGTGIFLSGLHPIMSHMEKDKLSTSISKAIRSPAVIKDLFDVVLDESAKDTIQNILRYKDIYMCEKCLSLWSKQSLTSIKKLDISVIQQTIEKVKKLFEGVVNGIDELYDKFKVFFSSQNGTTWKEVKKAYSKVAANMKQKVTDSKKEIEPLVDAYISGLRSYCEKFRDDAAVTGLDTLSHLDFETKLVYIIDLPTKLPEEIGQNLYPLVQLSHTEPMYIYIQNLPRVFL